MTFTVVASREDIITIERMLREICGGVSIDHDNGSVTMVGPAKGDKTEGCQCIRSLISSRRDVHIHPLPSPSSEIPGSGTGPDNPKKTIGRCTGGATVPASMDDASTNANGTPGPGSDTDVYIDMSNNNKHGYPAPRGSGARPPLWLILAHELTSGHAYHCAGGTITHTTGNAEQDKANRENQAIDSENQQRREHHLHLRPRRRPKTEEEDD